MLSETQSNKNQEEASSACLFLGSNALAVRKSGGCRGLKACPVPTGRLAFPPEHFGVPEPVTRTALPGQIPRKAPNPCAALPQLFSRRSLTAP